MAVGEILKGRFVIKSKVCDGGMSTVFRGFDLESEQAVAIKRLKTDANLHEITTEAFRRELDALSNLRHANILRILDHGKDDNGAHFLVLEWMECDLYERKTRKATEFDGWDSFASRILLPIVDALAYAHGNDRCHRDIKPANVLVTSDGCPRLADFGISKLKRSLQPRITLNEFMSVPFAPPEPDDGSFTFSRDVFGIGMLCLWAMSDVNLAGYEDIPNALERLDSNVDVRAIIERAVSIDPRRRYETAGLLAHELGRVQNSRERGWYEQRRPCCSVELTTKALSALREHFATETDDGIRHFVDQDIRSDPTIERALEKRGTPDEREVPDHFFVHGGAFSYRIAPNDKGRDCFSIISVVRPPDHVLSRIKENSLTSPVLFVIARGPKPLIPVKDALLTIDQQMLAEAEQNASLAEMRSEEQLFDQWTNLISARQAFEREQGVPIRFSSHRIEGNTIKLFTDDDLSDVQLEEPRVIKIRDQAWIHGDVWRIDSDGVVLRCPTSTLQHCPRTGVASINVTAAEKALDRQRVAIERVRHGHAVANQLRSLLLRPSDVCDVHESVELSEDAQSSLDVSQQEAVIAGLTSPDALIVEGPPGTGKTRFIAALVREFLRRQPDAKVLLASQTHIAIDNALARISSYVPDGAIVRVAPYGFDDVALESAPFLLPAQLKKWRAAVAKRSAEALAQWAEKLGVSPTEIRIGSVLHQIGLLRGSISGIRQKLHVAEQGHASPVDVQAEAAVDTSTAHTVAAQQDEADQEALNEEEVRELRNKLNADKVELDRLTGELSKLSSDAADYLAFSDDELLSWSRELLENSPDSRMATALLQLQSEWLERFGRDDSFTAALFERSNVIAATCVGLASVPGTDDIEYDLCIIDEASKADATAALVPMVRSRRWVLVGDSNQLPPFEDGVARSRDYRERFKVDSDDSLESMFERLRRLLPKDRQKSLRLQYRMVPAIGDLISHCFYKGELQNGQIKEEHIDGVLRGFKSRSVIWTSTRSLEDRGEQRHGDGVYLNTSEGEVVLDYLRALSNLDFGETETVSVLVISGYLAQVRHLTREVDREHHKLGKLRVECRTVDAVQGREADVVIYSVTRSNAGGEPGFLRSKQRVNVALSRARKLLAIVGDDEFILRARDIGALRDVLFYVRAHPESCLFEEYRPRLRFGGHQ